MEGIRRALVLGLVLIEETAIEQDPSVGPLFSPSSSHEYVWIISLCVIHGTPHTHTHAPYENNVLVHQTDVI